MMSVIIMKTYFMFNRVLCVCVLNFLLLVGIAAHASWIEPMGHIQPQKILLENNKINNRTAKRKSGKAPSAMEKKMYSKIPPPLDRGFLGEFNIGNTLVNASKLIKLIGKIVSRIM